MYCSKCGKKVKENSKFCENCGAKLEKTDILSSIKDKIPDDVKIKTKQTLKKGIKESKKVAKKVSDKVPNNIKKQAKEKSDKIMSKVPKQYHKPLIIVVIIVLICFIPKPHIFESEYIKQLRKAPFYLCDEGDAQHYTWDKALHKILKHVKYKVTKEKLYFDDGEKYYEYHLIITGRKRHNNEEVKLSYSAREINGKKPASIEDFEPDDLFLFDGFDCDYLK